MASRVGHHCFIFLIGSGGRGYFWPTLNCLGVLCDRRVLSHSAFQPADERFWLILALAWGKS
jgi:hypothetical protein